ncbi:MAG: HD domain-containing protein [Sphaerochaeta sp.]|nr:HD domain-containing protein [Sphaerochaeta sp.]
MKNVEKLLVHPQFLTYMALNSEAERDRIFCKHDFSHLFDVARVAYCMALERNLAIPKETMYLTALLHDIAKWKQYKTGADHAVESSTLAREILQDLTIEADEICEAIRTHRKAHLVKTPLGQILYDSDKAVRPCIVCPHIDTCKNFRNGEKPTFTY